MWPSDRLPRGIPAKRHMQHDPIISQIGLGTFGWVIRLWHQAPKQAVVT
jgi:hypothetical protein